MNTKEIGALLCRARGIWHCNENPDRVHEVAIIQVQLDRAVIGRDQDRQRALDVLFTEWIHDVGKDEPISDEIVCRFHSLINNPLQNKFGKSKEE
jgi:hypothetical protein